MNELLLSLTPVVVSLYFPFGQTTDALAVVLWLLFEFGIFEPFDLFVRSHMDLCKKIMCKKNQTNPEGYTIFWDRINSNRKLSKRLIKITKDKPFYSIFKIIFHRITQLLVHSLQIAQLIILSQRHGKEERIALILIEYWTIVTIDAHKLFKLYIVW